MAAVTIAPQVEAMIAIRDRVNTGETYCLPIRAEYTDLIVDPLEEILGYRVDITEESSETLNETLDVEDNTSHLIRIWIRRKLDGRTQGQVDQAQLLARQIFQRVNDYNTTDRRVMVWECDYEQLDKPLKEQLRTLGIFLEAILLRVEVGAA